MCARRCTARICRPSAWPRPSRRAVGRAERARAKRWSTPSRRCSTTRSRPAARRCAIIASTDGELGYFQHTFRVYDREGKPCPTPDCKGTIRRIVQGDALDVFLSGVPEVGASFPSPHEAKRRRERGAFSERPLPAHAFGVCHPLPQAGEGKARTRRARRNSSLHIHRLLRDDEIDPPIGAAPAGIPPAG